MPANLHGGPFLKKPVFDLLQPSTAPSSVPSSHNMEPSCISSKLSIRVFKTWSNIHRFSLFQSLVLMVMSTSSQWAILLALSCLNLVPFFQQGVDERWSLYDGIRDEEKEILLSIILVCYRKDWTQTLHIKVILLCHPNHPLEIAYNTFQ